METDAVGMGLELGIQTVLGSSHIYFGWTLFAATFDEVDYGWFQLLI